MRTHHGDLTIYTLADASKAAGITTITGGLRISAKGAQLPALTSVGGLYIHAEGAQLPALTSVGGGLRIHAKGAHLPALTSVGGWLDITAEGAQLPALTSVGGWLGIRAEGAQLPALTSVGGHRATLPVVLAVGLRWPVAILDEHMQIGCQTHRLDQWGTFDDADIATMDGDALDFWREHKDDLLRRAQDASRVF